MTTYPSAQIDDDQLADLGTRLIALMIDGLILAAVTVLLSIGTRGTSAEATFLSGVLIYQWYFLTRQNGQTPGKRIMGIRVVKVNGQPLQASDALMRYIGYSVDTLVFGIGWVWALFDPDRQCWHDKLVGTVVVRA